MDKIMRTDPKQSDENREEAELEEALKLWMEIRQVDRKKGWERLAALASIGTKASNRAISRLG